MEAPLQEALSQAKFSATLSLHLKQAYDKYIASCTISYAGGIFICNEVFIMWTKSIRDEVNALNHNEENKSNQAILLDSKNKPVYIEDINDFFDMVHNTVSGALLQYYNEYQSLVKERSVKKLTKANV